MSLLLSILAPWARQAQLTLPTPAAAEPRLGWRGGVDAAGQEYVDVSFGVGAVLRVHRADGGGLCPASGGASGGFVAGDWAAKLRHGLVLQYRVARGLADCAEIKVDVESAGHWFGGGHLMRQLWPLNRATWELGPHFPFDNGPTGLNTLVAPHFVTSSGFLLMADPATPFLHVGMNTPLRDTFKVRLLWYFLIPLAGSKRGISPGAAGGAGAGRLALQGPQPLRGPPPLWRGWEPHRLDLILD